jgi:hypothetical protein
VLVDLQRLSDVEGTGWTDAHRFIRRYLFQWSLANGSLDALSYLYPLHSPIWSCWIVWKCIAVHDTYKIISNPSKCLIAHPYTWICFVYVLSARLSLELSKRKVVPTLWGDTWVNQVVQGSSEALGPKWLTGNGHRTSDLVLSGEDTLCGGRGDHLPWWTSSLEEAASRWPRELGKCLTG